MKKIYQITRILVIGELVLLLAGFTIHDTPVPTSSVFSLDPDPPQAVCKDTVWVTVNADGTASIPAIQFDNGSTDNCPPLTFAAARTLPNCDGSMDDFSSMVNFCCEDAMLDDLEVILLVVDGVGNYDICTSVIVVQGAPTVECEPLLTVNIPPSGIVEINPDSLLVDAMGNCGGQLVALSLSADTSDQVYYANCDDLCTNPNVFELWATDDQGNQSFCETTVIVQDNSGFCGPCGSYIAGLITTAFDEGVEDVEVLVNDGQFSTTTDAQGFYQLEMPFGMEAWIFPERDTLPKEGVTTFDLVLIRRHILGIEPFDSPYKRIAADANNSGSISTLDMLVLQQLILGILDDFPSNTSWRFVDQDYEFPDPDNPWLEPFPEGILVPAATNEFEADFIAVKIGNVNG